MVTFSGRKVFVALITFKANPPPLILPVGDIPANVRVAPAVKLVLPASVMVAPAGE